MELLFLGTGAGTPSKKRNVSSIALCLFQERGTFWLFDCGEGTQHQIMKSSLGLGKLEKIFITHLHGDHLYGLPGLLTSRSHRGGNSPLTVYGPPGVRRFVETSLEVSRAVLDYELHFREFDEGTVYQDERFTVQTAKLEHRIDSYGFRVSENERPGPLQPEKLKAMGIPPGPLYHRLKKGEEVVLEDGTRLNGKDFTGPSIPGRVVTVLGDTRICSASLRLAREADVLVHEATFVEERSELAEKYFHSTAAGAARIAVESGAKTLILTHISSRYHHEEGEQTLLEQARAVFPHTHLARDLWVFSIPVKNKKY